MLYYFQWLCLGRVGETLGYEDRNVQRSLKGSVPKHHQLLLRRHCL